jgi:hypothetical protein
MATRLLLRLPLILTVLAAPRPPTRAEVACAFAYAPADVGLLLHHDGEPLVPSAAPCPPRNGTYDRAPSGASVRWVSPKTGALYRVDSGHIGLRSLRRSYFLARFPPARGRVAAADGTWVHVYRSSERFPEAQEGFGCWFFYLLGPWGRGAPGMVVNVGRSLVFRQRSQAVVWCRSDPSCSDAPGGAWASPERRVAHGFDSIQLDMGWAAKAARLGYDSIQLVWGQFGYPELIIARPECMAAPVRLGACAPPGIVRYAPSPETAAASGVVGGARHTPSQISSMRPAEGAPLPCVCADGLVMSPRYSPIVAARAATESRAGGTRTSYKSYLLNCAAVSQ